MYICQPKHSVRILLLAALPVLPDIYAAQPPQFDLLDLGRVGGTFPSSAIAINNRGEVAGNFEDATGFSCAFIYWRGTFILPGLPAEPYTDAYCTGINTRGTAVGISPGDTGFDSAFIYERGTLYSLSNVLQFPIVTRIAINDSRTMVGTVQRQDADKQFGFRYQHGVRTVLPGLMPDGQTSAHDLNNAGVAVGMAEFAPQTDPSFVNWHAAIFAG